MSEILLQQFDPVLAGTAARAEGCGPDEARREIRSQLDAWCREAHLLRRRPRRPAVGLYRRRNARGIDPQRLRPAG